MERLTFVKRTLICSRCLTESFYELINFIASLLSAGRALGNVREEWDSVNPKSTFPLNIRSTAENDIT